MSRRTTRLIAIGLSAFFALALALVLEQILLAPTPGAGAASPATWLLPGETALKDPVPASSAPAAPERLTAAEPVSDAFVPVPPAPQEEGLLGQITDARISGEDRDAFYLAVEANRRTESDGTPAFSALRTTAGRDHRASYGVGQLTIRDHLRELAELTDAELELIGLTRREVNELDRRSSAAHAWWTTLVESRVLHDAANALDTGVPELALARQLCVSRRTQLLVTRFGARFAETTSMPSEAIAELCASRVLRDSAMQSAFATQYRGDHAVAFDPAHRIGERMIGTAERVVAAHRELAPVFAQLGGDRSAALSLAHYLGVGDSNENLYGWCARAAAAAVGREHYVRILEVADPISTRLRELSNFENARAAVVGVRDLRGIERARMITRIGRCFHGAPGRALQTFFYDRDRSRPRASTAAELEAGLSEYRLSRTWSDERVQEAFDQVFAERRASQ